MFPYNNSLNILILHRLGDSRTWRESVVEKELCLPKFAPQHNYVIHDFWMPLPNYIGDIAFDAIILTQTFLGARRDPKMRDRIERVYSPILKQKCFKIALPQDDYTCSAILDRWLIDWGVDILYPACVNHWDVLYPNFSSYGELRQGYTGYINPSSIELTRQRQSMATRQVDVAYRADRLSPVYGRMGLIKSEFGNRFAEAVSDCGLRIDISTSPKKTIFGTKWYDFIQSTRCMLGVNSGSSILDPEGLIHEKIIRYQHLNPKSNFDEIESACFPCLDGLYKFTSISPRNLECGLFGTLQILDPGDYGGFIVPYEDYIPLFADMSNISDVLPLIRDVKYLEKIADHCRDRILSFSELRYTTHVHDLIEEIYSRTNLTEIERRKNFHLIQRYQKEISSKSRLFWEKHRIKTNTRKMIGDIGLRRVKYFIKYKIASNN
jgi:hypothetical protein